MSLMGVRKSFMLHKPVGGPANISPPITSGLVLHYDFNNENSYAGSGTTVTDMSSTGANGTLTNGPVFTSSSPSYLTLDGDNDYILAGNNAALECDVNNKISVAFAIDFAGFGDQYQRIVSKETAGLGVGGYAFTLGVDASDNFYFYSNGGSARMSSTGYTMGTLASVGWVICVFVYDGATSGNCLMKVNDTDYFNSGSYLTTTIGQNTSANVKIGTWYNNATREFNGRIGFVSIWDVALSSAQATTIFNTYKATYGIS